MGTTGEGILLDPAERRTVMEGFVSAAGDRIPVAVHAGAQTTAQSVALAEHAASIGAAAVAVIGPPYFKLDAEGQFRHLRAVARACHPRRSTSTSSRTPPATRSTPRCCCGCATCRTTSSA